MRSQGSKCPVRLVYFSYISYLELNVVWLIQAFLGVVPAVVLMTKSSLSSGRCNCKCHQEKSVLNTVMFVVESLGNSLVFLFRALFIKEIIKL